jgi:hypothetical protein
MPATTDRARDVTVLHVGCAYRMPDFVILPAHDHSAVARLTESAEPAV